MLGRLKNPFLAFSFGYGVVLLAVATWIGVGIVRYWPGYRGIDYGGGIVVSATLALIGLMLIALAFKPGWKN